MEWTVNGQRELQCVIVHAGNDLPSTVQDRYMSAEAAVTMKKIEAVARIDHH